MQQVSWAGWLIGTWRTHSTRSSPVAARHLQHRHKRPHPACYLSRPCPHPSRTCTAKPTKAVMARRPFFTSLVAMEGEFMPAGAGRGGRRGKTD